MRLGISILSGGKPPQDFAEILDRIVQAEKDGFDSILFNSGTAGDPLTVIAAAGRETSRIEMMTAIVITYLRHPFLMAQQALTANAACNGRLVLGIGPSHPVVMEPLGFRLDRAAAQVREYVTVLKALIVDRKVSFEGDFYKVDASLPLPWAPSCPVLVAALGPLMLRTAGELADGTVTWMVGLRTMREHVGPRINAAAAAAGRPQPRISLGLPVAVCDDEAAGRAEVARMLGNYGNLPSYRRVLDIEGGDAGDIVLCGNERRVEEQLRTFAAAGATEVGANILAIGDKPEATVARTRELLKSLVGKL
jgi:F420-dependent oxidoreductase-like protein